MPLDSEAAKQYYRYRDSNGRLVIKDHLPPEASQNGYEVLNSMMQVVKTVAPAKTPEELAAEEQRKQAEQDKIARRDAQLEDDKRLLRLYPNIQGAVNNRFTRAEILERDIKTSQDFIDILEEQIKTLRRDAAERERQGIAVSPKVQKEIKKAEQDIANAKQTQEKLIQDKQDALELSNNEIKRYLQITGNGVIERLKASVRGYDFNYQNAYWQVQCEQEKCTEFWPTVAKFVEQQQTNFDFRGDQVFFSPITTHGDWYIDAVTTETFDFDWHVFVTFKCTPKPKPEDFDDSFEEFDVGCHKQTKVDLVNKLHLMFKAAHPQVKT